MKNKRHKEYKELIEWLGEHFYAENFNFRDVTFDNPKERWKIAFG